MSLLYSDVREQPTQHSAFRYYSPGEYPDHGVGPGLCVDLGPVEDVGAVGHEDAAEEGVEEEELPDDVDEVEDVAEKVLEGVEVVHVEGLPHVLDQHLALVLPLVHVQGATCKVDI